MKLRSKLFCLLVVEEVECDSAKETMRSCIWGLRRAVDSEATGANPSNVYEFCVAVAGRLSAFNGEVGQSNMCSGLSIDSKSRKKIFAKRLIQFCRRVAITEKHIESSSLGTGLEQKLLAGILRENQGI